MGFLCAGCESREYSAWWLDSPDQACLSVPDPARAKNFLVRMTAELDIVPNQGV